MSHLLTDDFSRLQNQSRIPATTWREWCNLLKLDPIDAVDVWEEICHPIMVATRKIPEVPYILLMRAARLDLDIFDFKEEVPKVLHVITFLYALKNQRLIKDKTKSAGQILPQDGSAKSPRATPRFVFTEISRRFICGNIGSQGFTGP